MILYQTDYEGFFVGEASADPDPLNQENWLIPAGCVSVAPPSLLQGQRARFLNGAWIVVEPDPIPEPVDAAPPTKADQEANRRAAYAAESDPIFFMSQRGEATEAEWLAKIDEIKACYPYPAE